MSQGQILLSTTANVAGYQIVASRGIVFGVTVRSKGWGGDCAAGMESCCGGEVSTYTNVVIEGRNQALNRMIEEARTRGANAVVGLRFDSDQLGVNGNNNAIVAMGTAVVIQPLN